MKLKGKVALITGASRGVGLTIAKTFAKEGAKLALCSRSEADMKLAAKGIGKNAQPLACDVTKPEEIEAMVAKAVKHFGHVDVLVNNAGDAISAPLDKTDLDLWRRMIETNLTSVYLCCKAVYPHMKKRKEGRIINIASIAGKIGGKYISAYSASKHGVIGLTRSLAQELSDDGITCNAICPGYLDTPMTERSIRNITQKTGMSYHQAKRVLEGENPQRRLIPPEEVASLALFLASEAAAGITGEAINIW